MNHLISPSTAPWPIVALVVLILGYLLFRLVRLIVRIVRTYRELNAAYDEVAYLQATAKYHAKLKESEGRGY